MLRDTAADLLLGSSCVGCERPGRLLCARCAAALPTTARLAWPTPTPPGLAPPYAAATYAGTVRAMVLAHKEHRGWALTRPLGELLAVAVAPVARAGPVLLVPVPSRAAVVRERGHDPLSAMARQSASRLREAGAPARVAKVLRPTRRVADQAGLGAAARAANLAGSLRAVRPPGPAVRAVVVDDVLTTGATAREAQRALEAAGWQVEGIAVVAATVRRGLRGR